MIQNRENRHDPNGRIDRRSFFTGFGRYFFLVLIGGGSADLIRRYRKLDPEQQRCINKSVCCNCSAFERCVLPAALSARRAKAKGHGGAQ